jgi:hypothetical protein
MRGSKSEGEQLVAGVGNHTQQEEVACCGRACFQDAAGGGIFRAVRVLSLACRGTLVLLGVTRIVCCVLMVQSYRLMICWTAADINRRGGKSLTAELPRRTKRPSHSAHSTQKSSTAVPAGLRV